MTSNPKIKINLDSLKSRREWKRHKVKDGHNVFRILPPFGEASNGYAYRKWQIIWGLNNPSDGRMRPYASSFIAEKSCPVFEYVKELKAKSDRIKATLQASGSTEEVIRERLSGLNKLISDLSPKTVYIYNAVDKSGEVGLLELKSTAHKKMKAEMIQYLQDYNQDPTSINSNSDDSGVWFDVTRSGLGRDTEYDVKKFQVKVKDATTGKISFQDDQTALADNVVENFANLAYDLTTVYQQKTYAELAEILNANMPNLIELCPDADLNAPVTGFVAASVITLGTKPATTVANATKSLTKVQTKFDNADDEDEVTTSSDSFLAEADALLNS